MQYTPSTQPETAKQLFIRSLQLYRFAFSHVIILALILATASFIPRLLAIAIGQDVFATLPTLSPQRLWLVLLDLVGLVFLTAILWRMQCLITGIHETIQNDISVALRKLPYIVVTVMIQSTIFLLILLTTITFYSYLQQQNLLVNPNAFTIMMVILPWFLQIMINIYIAISFLFYLPLILTENKGIISSLMESAHLVWGKWWRTLRIQITPWVFYLITLLLLKFGAGLNIHIYFFHPTAQSLPATVFHIIVFALFVPWIAATLLVQLRDLELRKNP